MRSCKKTFYLFCSTRFTCRLNNKWNTQMLLFCLLCIWDLYLSVWTTADRQCCVCVWVWKHKTSKVHKLEMTTDGSYEIGWQNFVEYVSFCVESIDGVHPLHDSKSDIAFCDPFKGVADFLLDLMIAVCHYAVVCSVANTCLICLVLSTVRKMTWNNLLLSVKFCGLPIK